MTYSASIGIDTSIIVTPLPSGVMIAPKTKIPIVAKRQYFFQKSDRTIPRYDNPYMRMGSSNASPKASVNQMTKSMKSLPYRIRKFAPSEVWTENSRLNVNGSTTTKHRETPERNNTRTGSVTRKMRRLSDGFRAGPTNWPIS